MHIPDCHTSSRVPHKKKDMQKLTRQGIDLMWHDHKCQSGSSLKQVRKQIAHFELQHRSNYL